MGEISLIGRTTLRRKKLQSMTVFRTYYRDKEFVVVRTLVNKKAIVMQVEQKTTAKSEDQADSKSL